MQSTFKKLYHHMPEFLLEIINASIKNDTFSCFKKVVVKPVPKKGPVNEQSNYCPVILVPTLSKTLEKVI
jgi:hypothetical protein